MSRRLSGIVFTRTRSPLQNRLSSRSTLSTSSYRVSAHAFTSLIRCTGSLLRISR